MSVLSNCLDNALLYPLIRDMRRNDCVYASSLGFLTPDRVIGSCRRREYYRLTGAPETQETAESRRKMLYGEYVAKAEVWLAQKARIWIADEVAVFDMNARISGRIDLVVADPNAKGNPYIGVEIKSTYGEWSTRGQLYPDSNGRFCPKDYHLAQTAFYAMMYRSGIPRWMVRYLGRDTGATKDHEIVIMEDGGISANGVPTGRTIHELTAWAKSVWEHVDGKTLPPHDFSLVYSKEQLVQKAKDGEFGKVDTDKALRGHKLIKGDFNCRYCRYTPYCWAGIALPFDMDVSQALETFKR